MRVYRIIYNVIALITLFWLLFYMIGIRKELIFEQANWQKYLGLVLASWGVIVIRISFRHYPLKEFLGFTRENQGSLHTTGILNYVRHPIYSGTLLIVTGYFLFSPTITNLITAICFLLYILLGIQFEEKKLVLEFGEKYTEYRKRVAMLIPYII